MEILVNATALDSRGGFSVVNSFLNNLMNHLKELEENNINLRVLVSNEKLLDFNKTKRINVVLEKYPKRNFFCKYFYEKYIIPKIIKEKQIDAYLSLQNTGISSLNIPQFVLIHQPIPFSSLNISELELKNYIKYNFLLRLIYKLQIKKYSCIFVQTDWMRKEIISRFKYKGPIRVVRPDVPDIRQNNMALPKEIEEQFNNTNIKLLYVTNLEKYKNNKILIEAVNKYNSEFGEKVTLYLTIPGINTEYIRYLNKVPYQTISQLYQRADALIFPSLAETLGLPLLEAKQNNLRTLVSDLPYAREICNENDVFFNPRDCDSIVQAIGEFITSGKNSNLKDPSLKNHPFGSYIDYIRIIKSTISGA